AKLDAVYPDFTILDMEHESMKVSVTLLEVFPDRRMRLALNEVSPDGESSPAKLDGRDAVVVSTPERARLISREGESLWMITAQGPDAVNVLNRVVGGWKWISAE